MSRTGRVAGDLAAETEGAKDRRKKGLEGPEVGGSRSRGERSDDELV